MITKQNNTGKKVALPTPTSTKNMVVGGSGQTKVSEKVTPCSKSKVDAKREPPKKRKGWKKPEGKPKRPLSAYNLFFQDERKKMLQKVKKGAKIGFANMARTIGGKWKTIDSPTRQKYEGDAKLEKSKYFIELAKWKQDQVVCTGKGKVAKVQKKKITPPLTTSNSIYSNTLSPSKIKTTSKATTCKPSKKTPVSLTTFANCPTTSTPPKTTTTNMVMACTPPTSVQRSTTPGLTISAPKVQSSIVTPPISPKAVVTKTEEMPTYMNLDSQLMEDEHHHTDFNFSFAQKVFDPMNYDKSVSQEDPFKLLPLLEASDEDISEDEFSDFASSMDFSKDVVMVAEADFDVAFTI